MSDAPHPVSLPSDPKEIGIPFERDSLERKAFAVQITPLLAALAHNGGVMTIDAPWGEGKSWFGLNWCKQLEVGAEHAVCWIDAFEQDYIEDPFELVVSAMIATTSLKEDEVLIGQVGKLLDATGNVLALGTKLAGRYGAAALALFAGGTPVESAALTATGAAVGDHLSNPVQTTVGAVRARLEVHSARKDTIGEFRTRLREIVAAQGKPLVVFVDELDRCRPDFAVRLIECIKHFFDVPNVVFVLLLNRDQLEKAVKGVYGAEVDAHLYLQKFIHLPIGLPKVEASRYQTYLDVLFKHRFNFLEQPDDWIGQLTEMGQALDLSLRDLERAVAMVILTRLPAYPPCVLAICLKAKSQAWFEGLLRRDMSVCKQFLDAIDSNTRSNPWGSQTYGWIVPFVRRWSEGLDELEENHIQSCPAQFRSRREFFAAMLQVLATGRRWG